MRAVTSWDPFKELDVFQDRLASVFGYEPAKLNGGKTSELVEQENWRPVVDIGEDDKAFTITAELPSVKKEDVKLTIVDGMLIVSGERKIEKEEKEKKFHRIERSFGSFRRSFTLSDNIDTENIKASYKDGLLTVKLPKSETPEKKAVEIQLT